LKKKQILLIVSLISGITAIFLISCSSPLGTDNNNSTEIQKYNLTTEEGLLAAIQDEEFMKTIMEDTHSQTSTINRAPANGIWGDVNSDGDVEIVIIGISYYDSNNADLICSVSDDRGDTWNKYIIDETGDVGYSSSIVVSGNNIYICYIADMVCMLPEPGVNGMRMNIL
jgi:hypothetical protein